MSGSIKSRYPYQGVSLGKRPGEGEMWLDLKINYRYCVKIGICIYRLNNRIDISTC